MKGEKMRKLLTWLTAAALLAGSFPFGAYTAHAEAPSDTALEAGRSYVVPMIRRDRSGEVMDWGEENQDYPMDHWASDTVAPYALVTPDPSGGYTVTMEHAFYEAYDGVQFYRQEETPDGTDVNTLPLGTKGVRDPFVVDYSKDGYGNIETLPRKYAERDFTEILRSMLHEDENSRLYDVSVKNTERGVSYLTIHLDRLDSPLYFAQIVTAYYTEGLSTRAKKKLDNRTEEGRGLIQNNLEKMCIIRGSYLFDTSSASPAPAMTGDTAGREVSLAAYRWNIAGNDPATRQADQILSSRVELSAGEGGALTALFTTVAEKNVTAVKEATGVRELELDPDIDDFDSIRTHYKWQAAGRYPGASAERSSDRSYSDDLLSEGKFSLTYSSIEEAVFGKIVRVNVDVPSPYEEKSEPGFYEFMLRLAPGDDAPAPPGDTSRSYSSGGVSFTTQPDALDARAVFEAQKLESGQEYDAIQGLLNAYSADSVSYRTTLTLDGSPTALSQPADISFETPQSWNNKAVSVYTLSSDSAQGYMLSPVATGTAAGGAYTLQTTDLNQVYVLSLDNEPANLKELNLADGVYSADMAFWNATQRDQISMSNSAVAPGTTVLTVHDGEYRIYFKLRGIQVRDVVGHVRNLYYQGANRLKPNELTEADYMSYVTNDEGTSVYEVDYHAQKFPQLYYPELFSFVLPQGAINKNLYKVAFYVPMMAELSSVAIDSITDPPGQGVTQPAIIKFYNVRPKEDGIVPGYEPSWLLKSVEDAQKFTDAGEDVKAMYNRQALTALTGRVSAARQTLAIQKLLPSSQTIYDTSRDLDAAVSDFVKISLNDQITRARQARRENYEEDRYNAIMGALETAIREYNDENGTTGEKNDALVKLYAALEGIAPKEETDRAALEAALENARAEAAKTQEYTASSIARLQELIDEAAALLGDKSATQEQIDSRTSSLEAGVRALVRAADKSQLRQKYEEAAPVHEEGNTGGKYQSRAWERFAQAFAKAGEVLDNTDASEGQVQSALTALVNAMNDLSASVDKSALLALLGDMSKMNLDYFTPESGEAVRAAVASGQQTADNEDATQSEVDRQYELLSKVIRAVVMKKQDDVVYDGTYSLFGRLWKATQDVPENWKEDSAGGASLGDPALDRDVRVEIRDGKPVITVQFIQRTLTLFGEEKKGYLKSLSYFPAYSGEDYPETDQPVEAEILQYWEDEEGNRISDEYGTDYPRYLRMTFDQTVDSLGSRPIWVKVNVPVMDTITPGSGTQPVKLVLDWNGRRQLTGTDTDKTRLEELIAQAESASVQGAAPEQAAALRAMLVSAKNVDEDMNTTQDTVDAVAAALQAAIDALSPALQQQTDKSDLQRALAAAKEHMENPDVTYTPESLELLTQAYERGKALYEKEDASQAQINAAVVNIDNAVGTLAVVSDKTRLRSAIEAAEHILGQTGVYTQESMNNLTKQTEAARTVYDDPNADQSRVDAAVSALEYISAHMERINPDHTDKDALVRLITVAASLTGSSHLYTNESAAALRSALSEAQAVYANDQADTAAVRAALNKLTNAILALVRAADTGVYTGGRPSGTDNSGGDGAGDTDGSLDIRNLPDGVYALSGNMVKVDRRTASMSDAAISHTIKLTVKDGAYALTMNFKGLTVSGKLGYLGTLKYYMTGYGTDQYGSPTGELGQVTVDTVQKYDDGSVVSDTYGTDYPAQVTFPMIPEALNDGYVPLQVTVPLMETLGAGVHPVYLHLDWGTLKKTTEDDANFAPAGDNGDNRPASVATPAQTGKPASTGLTLAGSRTLPALGNTAFSGNAGVRPTGVGLSSGGGLKSAASVKPASTGLKSAAASSLKAKPGAKTTLKTSKKTTPESVTGKKKEAAGAGTKAAAAQNKAGGTGADKGRAAQTAAAAAMAVVAAAAGLLYKFRLRRLFFGA